jgi:hypothetical protein
MRTSVTAFGVSTVVTAYATSAVYNTSDENATMKLMDIMLWQSIVSDRQAHAPIKHALQPAELDDLYGLTISDWLSSAALNAANDTGSLMRAHLWESIASAESEALEESHKWESIQTSHLAPFVVFAAIAVLMVSLFLVYTVIAEIVINRELDCYKLSNMLCRCWSRTVMQHQGLFSRARYDQSFDENDSAVEMVELLSAGFEDGGVDENDSQSSQDGLPNLASLTQSEIPRAETMARLEIDTSAAARLRV